MTLPQNTTDLAASQGIGIPTGVILVWLLETFVLADPVPAVVAIAFGTVIGGVIQFIKSRFNHEKDIPANPGGTD